MPTAPIDRLTEAGRERPARLARVAAAVASLTGWRRWLVAWLLGLGSMLAFPPVGWFPALFVALPALVWQLDGTATKRAAFAVGWWFGLGHFMAGTYWISNSLLVEADRFAWLIPPTLVGVSAYLAVYPALAAAFARWVRPGWPRIAALAVAWTGFEMLRGVAFTGFPWNPVGSIWTDIPSMMQPAAAIGVYGLGLITVGLAAVPARLAAGRRSAVAAALGVPLALALIWGAGSLRLERAQTAVHPGVRIGIVQPNIAQREKIRAAFRTRHFARHLEMTEAAAGAGATHFIWPETAIGFGLSRAPGTAQAIARAVPEGGLVIAGALRTGPPGERPRRFWNSLIAVDGAARRVAVYDKARLVPFGEYVPLRSVLAFTQVTGGRIDFSRGPGRRTLAVPGLPPFGPLICYEMIFPGQVVDPDRRPEWLLNVTNDGWFGESAGPYQHFAAARMRAVEEGLPVVRAANSGISAVIDPYGRVVERLGLGRQGVLHAALPAALSQPTAFARFGHAPVLAVMALAAAGLAARRRRKRPRRS